MSIITRDLPNNQYEAALASNLPSAANPFATASDLATFVSNNIYIGDGDLTGDRIVTGLSNSLTFTDLSNYLVSVNATGSAKMSFNDGAGVSVVGGVGLNTVGFGVKGSVASVITPGATNVFGGVYELSGDSYIDQQVYTAGGESSGFFTGPWSGAAASFSSMYFRNATINNGFQADEFGERLISQSAGLTRIDTIDFAAGMSFLTSAGSPGYLGSVSQLGFKDWISNSGTESWGGIYEGSGTIPTTTIATMTDTLQFDNASMILRGQGNTNATTILSLNNLSNNIKFAIGSDGQISTGAGQTAISSPSFGQIHRSNNYGIGFGFFPTNATSTGFSVQPQGTTRTGLEVLCQNNPSGGAVIAMRARVLSIASSNNTGLDGFARNGGVTSVGVRGSAGGGSGILSTLYTAGVEGSNGDNLDSLKYGGKFSSISQFAGAKTRDIIGVSAIATNSSVASGSTSKAIGGSFSTATPGGVAQDNNIALHVPSTDNDGGVLFGADSRSANFTFVEIHNGDLEVVTDGDGIILNSPSGDRFKYTATDVNGSLTITPL